jgi:hypothetical protein
MEPLISRKTNVKSERLIAGLEADAWVERNDVQNAGPRR